MIDYLTIIHKYISPESPTYRLYIIHVTLVTQKALQIAKRHNLTLEQMNFIEEAGMLHDIGIVRVDDKDLKTTGPHPYICHMTEGAEILRNEGLPKHALVCERHTGVGITLEEINTHNLPLPPGDYVAQTIEEEIISYADLFFTKVPDKIWDVRSVEQVSQSLAKHGDDKAEKFQVWVQKFEPELLKH